LLLGDPRLWSRLGSWICRLSPFDSRVTIHADEEEYHADLREPAHWRALLSRLPAASPSRNGGGPASRTERSGPARAPWVRPAGDTIDFSKIVLDPQPYYQTLRLSQAHSGANPGCCMHPHWVQANLADQRAIEATGRFSALHWLGNGYPMKTRYRHPEDPHNLSRHFANLDCLDVQAGLRKFYAIAEAFTRQGVDFWNLPSIRVLEVGGGYGRLALFFLAHFGARCHYVSVDFVPSSLTYCPQVVRQCFPDLSVLGLPECENAPHPPEGRHFVSWPAWQADRLGADYDLGVNIQSFGEMVKETFRFYVEQFWSHLRPGALMYSVNSVPAQTHYPGKDHSWYGFENRFTALSRRPHPLGRPICGIPTQECVYRKD